jgi:hypothetical protein
VKHNASAEAFLAELDNELAENAAASGQELGWSASEKKVRELIGNGLTRMGDLQSAYDRAGDNPKLLVALSTELRLLEANVSRMLRQVSTEPPAPQSRVSHQNRRAANIRWARERERDLGVVNDG